jgi:hypothetical protein
MPEFARRLTRPPLLRTSPLAHLRDYFDSTFSCVHLHGVIVSSG